MADFSRVEITLSDRDSIKRAGAELSSLATKLSLIGHDKQNTDEAALLLARQRIKETSQKLRKGQ